MTSVSLSPLLAEETNSLGSLHPGSATWSIGKHRLCPEGPTLIRGRGGRLECVSVLPGRAGCALWQETQDPARMNGNQRAHILGTWKASGPSKP